MKLANSPRRDANRNQGEPTGAPQRSNQVVALALLLTLTASHACAAHDAARAEAQRLIAASAKAEVSGDSSRSLSLLQEAIASDPDNQLARWQLGQLRVDDKWMPVEEAQHRAATDPLQSEYAQRCAAAGDNLDDQLALTRWCRKNKLEDESQLHWSAVLSLDPSNDEALRVLTLRWKDGQIVSRNESSRQKQLVQEAKNAAKRWEPIIAKWRRAVAGRDVSAHDAAIAEIRSINKVDAIPSMESVTLGRDAFELKHAEDCLQITLAFLDALEKMPDQAATESIARHAVYSPGNKARVLASEKLKSRDEDSYVPLLLSGLSMPIETTYSVTTDADGNVRYAQSLYQERPDADVAIDTNNFTMQHILAGKDFVVAPGTDKLQENAAAAIRNSQSRYARAALVLEAQVQQANYTSAQITARIIPVLTSTTGKEFGTAKQWWDWWRDKNEYYTSEHPVDYRYYSNTDDQYVGKTYDTYSPPQRHSCFGKGTLVWTKTGRKAIETLGRGDFALAQNVSTGELSYKPVIVRTQRPKGPMVKLSLAHEELLSTTGHPFWIAGQGWRMAKELEEGAVIHCVKGTTRIRAIENSDDSEAYNLEVADFNTYFVGQSGMLVHDITQRKPTETVVPGVAVQ